MLQTTIQFVSQSQEQVEWNRKQTLYYFSMTFKQRHQQTTFKSN